MKRIIVFSIFVLGQMSIALAQGLSGGSGLSGSSSPSSLLTLLSTGVLGWNNSSGTMDLILSRKTTAVLQLGAADAAAPVAQTMAAQSVVAGTSNTAGVNWTVKASASTGTGAGGSIIFQVTPAGSTGTAQNAYATAVTIDSTKRTSFAGPARLQGYTVATLPSSPLAGDEAYVTDQLTACPVLSGTFTGGGAVTCKAFYNGTAWTHE